MDNFDPVLIGILRNDIAALLDEQPQMSLDDAFEIALENSPAAQTYLKDKSE